MKRGIIVLAAAAVVAVGAFALFWKGQRSPELVLSGTVEARDVDVGSLVGGRVETVHVDEGALVRAGQPIVTLEPDLLDRQIREQEARVGSARANLAKALNGPRREETERARVEWRNAEKERQRQDALLRQGLAPQQQYDNAAAAARMARQSYDELARGNRPEDIAAAHAGLAEQEGQLAFLQRQKEELVVRAPADGVVATMDMRPGDLVAPNQAVATLLEPGEIWVRVYVPEPQLGLVKLNEPAAISVDTFPRRTFPGKVVEIRQRSEYTPRNVQTLEQRGDQVFGVKVAIDPAPELKPGMAAIVHLRP
ncbi:MAG: HlyD family secretion protein [Thermoanaerobaculia bacterium]